MVERGLLPSVSAAATSAQLERIQRAAVASTDAEGDATGIRDLTALRWASIDNDHSRDLDQVTVAEPRSNSYSGSARRVVPVRTSSRMIRRVLSGSSSKGLWADWSNV